MEWIYITGTHNNMSEIPLIKRLIFYPGPIPAFVMAI